MPASGKMAAPDARIQQSVLVKLVLFAVLMAVVPIGTYFGTLTYAFDGKTTPAAIAAVAAANAVLVGYVVVAFREEAADARARGGEAKDKKAQ
ncbi:vacuolar ATPase assembly integral membrane protein vma21 [Cryptotrichosporon argae]